MKTKDVVYVSTQLILFLAYVSVPTVSSTIMPDWWKYLCYFSSTIGFVIVVMAIIQLKTSLSPFPSPTTANELVDSGLYAFARHPIYTGIIIICLFYASVSLDMSKIAVTIVLFILFYFKAKYEERLLIKKHPDYSNYQKRVGMFLTLPFGREK